VWLSSGGPVADRGEDGTSVADFTVTAGRRLVGPRSADPDLTGSLGTGARLPRGSVCVMGRYS
jgi:hypothetical protein